MDYLPDVLTVLGLATMTTGVAILFGFPWALILLGLLLFAIGMAATWKRSG